MDKFMKRTFFYNYIEEKLTVLTNRIKQNGKLNLLDLNIHSENFFARLLNIIFKYNFVNANKREQNSPSVDLIDNNIRCVFQVTSTCTKTKIESTLEKKALQKYADDGYNIKFMFIANDAGKLKINKFKNPYNILFNPVTDLYDINDILKIIVNMDIEEQKEVYDFVRNELGDEPDLVKIDSNLADIINMLANEDLSNIGNEINVDKYNIDKKIEFNNLITTKEIISEYRIFYSKIDEIYKEFDKQGKNKSFSVLQAIKREYILLLSNKIYTDDQIFLMIIDRVIQIIQSSRNYIEIPYEELEMCTDILVVDAFIRCKIFKNPEGYSYVTSW